MFRKTVFRGAIMNIKNTLACLLLVLSGVLTADEITTESEKNPILHHGGFMDLPRVKSGDIELSIKLIQDFSAGFAPVFFIDQMFFSPLNDDANTEDRALSTLDLDSGRLEIFGLTAGENQYDIILEQSEDDKFYLTHLSKSDEISWLFLITASQISSRESAVYDNAGTLDSHFVIPIEGTTTIQFSDRPHHVAGDFVGGVEGLVDFFRHSDFMTNYPNVSFVGTKTDTGELIASILEVDDMFDLGGNVIIHALKTLDGSDPPLLGDYSNASFIFDTTINTNTSPGTTPTLNPANDSSVPEGSAVSAKLREAIKTYAPRIFMHQDEQWFPSSVSWFQQYVNRVDNRYKTKETLSSPSDYSWQGAYGESLTSSNQPPVYAVVVRNQQPGNCNPDAQTPLIDVYYFTFFPYNRGKQVCMGPFYDNYCPAYCPWPLNKKCCLPRINGCATEYTAFGNHVGDWETVTVRFSGDDTSGYSPLAVAGSAHGGGNIKTWSDAPKTGTHPILFSAQGSHGMYFNTGCVAYQTLVPDSVNMFILPGSVRQEQKLKDCMGSGTAWDTWNNVVVVEQQSTGTWRCDDGSTVNVENCSDWLNFPSDFRWGNERDGCGGFNIFKQVSGECRLNSGPTGPTTKGFVSKPNACI
jgi:hypothetical protein